MTEYILSLNIDLLVFIIVSFILIYFFELSVKSTGIFKSFYAIVGSMFIFEGMIFSNFLLYSISETSAIIINFLRYVFFLTGSSLAIVGIFYLLPISRKKKN